MASTFDWQSLEDRLFEQSKALILQFAEEHPDVTCSFLAYDTNTGAEAESGYGYLGLLDHGSHRIGPDSRLIDYRKASLQHINIKGA